MTHVERPPLRIRDPKIMRALAHPARMAIVEHLMTTTAAATATECAEVVGLSPSATSYHLRALARAGLIEEAPSRGDGRERLWQSPEHGLELDADSRNDPEARAAEQDLVTVLLNRQHAKALAWFAVSFDEPADWRDAASFFEARLLVTAEELAELRHSIADLMEPYRYRRRRDDPPPGARPVAAITHLFPEPASAPAPPLSPLGPASIR
jgi:DNA-binding transcriptional ArsR family regulator